MSDLLLADATTQLVALASRQLSSLELLKLALARHEQTHRRLNAVVAADIERALETAKAVDDLRVKGAPLGALAGLPMTVKDTLDVMGLPASSGLEVYRRRKPDDAVVVAQVRRAGAVLWGKTNVPVLAGDWQTANPLYGVSNNPWDVTRTPGGSSGGAAAALASGVTPLEIGSDIGGSLRVPASFCGLFSHKPTWGAVSQIGHVPPAPGSHVERDLNVVGPMARSARDLRLLLSVMGGPVGAKAPPADLSRLRVGVWLDDFPLDPQVRAVVEDLAVKLTGAGASVQPIVSPIATDELMGSYQVLLGGIIGTDMPPAALRRMQRLRGLANLALSLGADPQSWAGLTRSYAASHAEWLVADEARARLSHTMVSAFSKLDVILAPAAPVVAFHHDGRPFQKRRLTTSTGTKLPYTAMLNWIALATACRLPVTTVPAGLSASGLPVGVQIIGPQGGDAKTLAVAQAIDENFTGYQPPPGA